jgi:hypothetical protein
MIGWRLIHHDDVQVTWGPTASTHHGPDQVADQREGDPKGERANINKDVRESFERNTIDERNGVPPTDGSVVCGKDLDMADHRIGKPGP